VKKKLGVVPQNVQDLYISLISPVTNFFIKLGINPNFFTTLGLIISGIATYLFATGQFRWGGLLVLVAGTCDIMDGKIARATDRATKFGALYDSTLDRYGEVMVLFGLAFYYSKNIFMLFGADLSTLLILAISMSLGGSVMTSYVRARAEGLDMDCKVGIMIRTERIIFLGFGAIIHELVLVIALVIIAIFANITAIQRLYYVWKTEKGEQLTGGTKLEN
jgi:CDP-diacylglycerol--glycerol-3-phosphate 3-phosphatidyltransferase